MGPSASALARRLPTVDQYALKMQAEGQIAKWQPSQPPRAVWSASPGTLAPGVNITAPDRITSQIGTVESTGDRFVSVRGPDDTVRDEALEKIIAINWRLEWPGSRYLLTPPRDASPAEIAGQTIKALTALSCLMPPGMSGVRSVGIDVTRLSDPVRTALGAGVCACYGLGLGTVEPFSIWGFRESVGLGTVVPIFAPPELLTEEAQANGLRRTLLNYMAAVMAPGRSAGPYNFHLVVDAGSRAKEPVRRLFDNLQDDPRLASGAGWVSKAAWYSGLVLAFSGLWMASGYDASTDTVEMWPAFRNILEGMGLFAAATVYGNRTDQRSREWPAITTPFSLTVWSDLESTSSNPLTLHRTARNNGTMYTEVRKLG